MDHQQAYNFVNSLAKVWVDCDLDALQRYDQSFTADYYGEKVTYDDLVARLAHMKQHQQQREMKVLDVISESNKIAARMHYKANDKDDGNVDMEIAVIYHLNEHNKVIRAWAFANTKVNYRR